MDVRNDRRYTDAHEWVLVVGDGSTVRIGISDFAQDALGDIVYVDLPDVGSTIGAGSTLAEVESTKSVGEVYAPVGGTVLAVNSALEEQPELVNSDPYDAGWIVELSIDDPTVLDTLLDADGYRTLTTNHRLSSREKLPHR